MSVNMGLSRVKDKAKTRVCNITGPQNLQTGTAIQRKKSNTNTFSRKISALLCIDVIISFLFRNNKLNHDFDNINLSFNVFCIVVCMNFISKTAIVVPIAMVISVSYSLTLLSMLSGPCVCLFDKR